MVLCSQRSQRISSQEPWQTLKIQPTNAWLLLLLKRALPEGKETLIVNIILLLYIISVNRIIQIFRLEGASGCYLVQYPAQSRTAIKFRLLEALSAQVFKTSMEGDSTASLDLTVLRVKFFVLLSVKILALSSQ